MKGRILFIDEDQQRNGSTVSLEYIVRAFHKADYDPVVLTWKTQEREMEWLRRHATLLDGRRGPVNTVTMCFHFMYTASAFSLAGIKNIVKDMVKFVTGFFLIRRVIREVRPVLVYLNEYSIVQGALAARTCGVPTAMHIRSLMLEGSCGIRRKLMACMVRRWVDAVFAITQVEAEQFRTHEGVPGKVQVIGEFVPMIAGERSGPDHERVEVPLPPGRKVVLMLGGFLEIKGSLDFLQAAGSVLAQRPDTVFVLAGSPKGDIDVVRAAYDKECADVSAPLLASGGLLLPGSVSRPLELMAACDVLIAPTRQTHFSRPVVEAWSCGKPVIAYRVPHLENLIAHDRDGLLVEPGDIGGLVAAILRLLNDGALARTMGERGREKAAASFDERTNLAAIVDRCASLMRAS